MLTANIGALIVRIIVRIGFGGALFSQVALRYGSPKGIMGNSSGFY